MSSKKKKRRSSATGGGGINVGGNFSISGTKGQVAVGNKNVQKQTLSSSEKKELHDNLTKFQTEVAKLNLPQEKATKINEGVAAAAEESAKGKPNIDKIGESVKNVVDVIKEIGGDTKATVSKWEWTKKILATIGKVGLKILL
ncbi:MAG: hypothetical protein ACE14S_10930 [Candidatus Bathyarchaeia archaeon]